MPPEYQVFINSYWFDRLQSADEVNDKPVFFRHHEQALWIIFQVLRAGGHRATITTTTRQVVAEFNTAPDFAAWVAAQYPGMAAQLSQPIYTRFPHPQSELGPAGELPR